MMAFCPEHPKGDQNPKFIPLSETMSIPTPFIRGVPHRATTSTLGIILKGMAPVVQKVDNAIHWINHYPLNSAIGFPNTYPWDSDLSVGKRYPTFEQPGPFV